MFHSEPRIALVPAEASVKSCGHLRNFARDVGRPRGDLWENALWAKSLTVHGRDLYFFQAIHQESDAVPENVDAAAH